MTSLNVSRAGNAPAISTPLERMLDGLQNKVREWHVQAAENPGAVAKELPLLRNTLVVIRDNVRQGTPENQSAYRDLLRNCKLLELETQPAAKKTEAVVQVFGVFRTRDIFTHMSKFLSPKDLAAAMSTCRWASNKALGEAAFRSQVEPLQVLQFRHIGNFQRQLHLGQNDFAGLFKHCKNNLTRLEIDADITDLDIDRLSSSLEDLPNFSGLHIYGSLTKPPVKAKTLLCSILNQRSLTDVSLTCFGGRGWSADNEDVQRVADTCPGLRKLYLHSPQITDGALIDLISKCSDLQEVTLLGCRRLGNPTAQALTQCQQLRHFGLPNTVSMRERIELAKALPNLISFEVGGNELTEEDIVQLATSPHPNLRQVSFANSQIMLRHIAFFLDQSPQLRHVDLSGCKNISLDAIKDLVVKHPHVAIVLTKPRPRITGESDTIIVMVKSKRSSADMRDYVTPNEIITVE